MLRYFFISVHPKFIESYFTFGTFRRAREAKIAEFYSIDLRDFAVDGHGSVDDKPYGGGEGMVLRPEPLAAAVKHIQEKILSGEKSKVILTSPQGVEWHYSVCEELAIEDISYVFVCGRFSGVDQRFIDRYVDMEVSIGNYILSGGELAALVIGDSLLRRLEGAVGNFASVKNDSYSPEFNRGLEYPLYTRPAVFEGVSVPEVLTSGNQAKIDAWRKENIEK